VIEIEKFASQRSAKSGELLDHHASLADAGPEKVLRPALVLFDEIGPHFASVSLSAQLEPE